MISSKTYHFRKSYGAALKHQALSAIGLFALCASLAGCIFPGVFRIDVAQGNIVTEKMVAQLKPGMTREQVLYVMGTPIIQDTLHPDRWDYVYSISRAGTTPELYHVKLIFEGNKFVSVEGQPPPASVVY
jgi:outer membrane protein assembly factor BamE